jgi:hypothetical protein
MSKHTPGPWAANPSNAERYSQYVAPKDLKSWPYDVVAYIPEAYGDKCTFPGAHMANARLIAAAPDLLDALQSVVSAWETGKPYVNEMGAARAAIARATGETA